MQGANMRVRTVRQVKQQQKPRNKANILQGSNESSDFTGVANLASAAPPAPPPKPISPPYRMPPQPPGASPIHFGESPIPGAAANEVPLRMHSAKFPIERESNLVPMSAENISGKGASSKIPLIANQPRTPSGPRRTAGISLLPRTSGAIAPDHPAKQMQAWNSQHHSVQIDSLQSMQLQSNALLTGAIPRTPARLPEDVTALANDSNKDRDPINKNAVTKTYHTLKDLISGKFKRDPSLEATSTDELNNATHYQPQLPHQQPQQLIQDGSEQQSLNAANDEDYRSPYSALPIHMRQNYALQSQPNIWNGKPAGSAPMPTGPAGGSPRSYGPPELPRAVQQRAISQPQLNMAPFDRRDSQSHVAQMDRRGSLANIDVTDSDDGGFAVRRTPQTMHQMQPASSQSMPQRNSPQSFQQLNPYSSHLHQYNTPSPYQQHIHNNSNHGNFNSSFAHQLQQQTQQSHMGDSSYSAPQHHQNGSYSTAVNQTQLMADASGSDALLQHQTRQDALRSSFQKTNPHPSNAPNSYQLQSANQPPNMMAQRSDIIRMPSQQQQPPQIQPNHPQEHIPPKPMPGSAGSSDYDKSGNHSSNVDSGRGSAAYSSGRKATLDADTTEVTKRLSMANNLHTTNGNDDSEWVDIVDAELRNILVPGMQGLMNRPSSTVSGSVSSMSPPLPPLSPGGSSYKPVKTKQQDKTTKQEYGTDSYNRPGRSSAAIGPSRAGWPGSSVQKQLAPPPRGAAKKQDQAMLKRHLFGLDNDMTSTTTRSLDLESILGAPWGTGQSVSDSETDTQGIRHIRSQLEGLENMYGEVMKMLGSRGGGPTMSRMHEAPLRGGAAARRRHGSLSSLPSSSVSGRPIRDRRRTDDRRKVRDIKGINKRFQRLESHVVTLARSVAHLSSEMRSQHQVTQELERLRDDLTALRSQSMRQHQFNHNATNGHDPEPPNLTNPRRVKKLTKFFGEDPPLMRLFLKSLGYEKYATLFEAERVGMIELPYLGEERLQKLGVPLGPRLRILQEAQISLCKDTTLCIV